MTQVMEKGASELLRPAAEWELQSIVARLGQHKQPIEVVGLGGLRNAGRPVYAPVVLSTSSLRGISLYEPNELVMSARSGTPLLEVEATLAEHGQMLAFEPMDLGPATGGPAGAQSMGGVFATNLSGARRVSAGSARDHLIGARGVNGRGEVFKSGGRVMKNVTGYDVARAVTGSWGTLAVLSEVTFKVAPLPESILTLVYPKLPDDLAVELMTVAMGTTAEITGAAHLQRPLAGRLQNAKLKNAGEALTLLRLENFVPSIAYRKDKLKQALKIYGTPLELGTEESWSLWADLRRLSVLPFSTETSLWRISTAPTKAPEIVATLQKFMPSVAYYDWSGGLVWLEVAAQADAGAADVRRAVAVRGGHATLMRATPEVRYAVDVFEPLKPEIERLTRGLKAAFDPEGLFNPGRMYPAF